MDRTWMMRSRNIMVAMVFGLIVTGATTFASTGGPRHSLKQMTDRIISILTDPDLEGQSKVAEKKQRIYDAVEGRFDWEDIGRRTLARHWRARTADEKKYFLTLFKQLLKRTYLDKVEGYSGETVIYGEEVLDGDFGHVKAKVMTDKNRAIDVAYKLNRREADWLIYDIVVEGVSLVNNYRVQFNNIILRSSYEALVEKLQQKVADE